MLKVHRNLFSAGVILSAVFFAGSLAAVEVEYYWARAVGDYGVSTSASLNDAGDISFNYPQTLRTVPVIRTFDTVTFLEDENTPKAVVTDVNSSGIAVGYIREFTGDFASVWHDNEWHKIDCVGSHYY